MNGTKNTHPFFFFFLRIAIDKMYVCGITPYAPCHLGHAMSYIVFDTIRRYPNSASPTTKLNMCKTSPT